MTKDKIHRLFERIVEILFSLFFLLSIFPLIYIVVAVVVKRRSAGPAIVMRPRLRADGQTFLAYRFRLANEESFLARMPQLINILCGSMPIHIKVSMDEGQAVEVEEPKESEVFVYEPINEPIDEPINEETIDEPINSVNINPDNNVNI